MWWAVLFLIPAASAAKDWDILMFTQHWPTTVCAQFMQESDCHRCLAPKVDNSWMVHGVWPTKLGTRGPEYCDSYPFSLKEIIDLSTKMDIVWPNLEQGQDIDSLWKHEWAKHGTCARSLPALSSEVHNKHFFK